MLEMIVGSMNKALRMEKNKYFLKLEQGCIKYETYNVYEIRLVAVENPFNYKVLLRSNVRVSEYEEKIVKDLQKHFLYQLITELMFGIPTEGKIMDERGKTITTLTDIITEWKQNTTDQE